MILSLLKFSDIGLPFDLKWQVGKHHIRFEVDGIHAEVRVFIGSGWTLRIDVTFDGAPVYRNAPLKDLDLEAWDTIVELLYAQAADMANADLANATKMWARATATPGE